MDKAGARDKIGISINDSWAVSAALAGKMVSKALVARLRRKPLEDRRRKGIQRLLRAATTSLIIAGDGGDGETRLAGELGLLWGSTSTSTLQPLDLFEWLRCTVRRVLKMCFGSQGRGRRVTGRQVQVAGSSRAWAKRPDETSVGGFREYCEGKSSGMRSAAVVAENCLCE